MIPIPSGAQIVWFCFYSLSHIQFHAIVDNCHSTLNPKEGFFGLKARWFFKKDILAKYEGTPAFARSTQNMS